MYFGLDKFGHEDIVCIRVATRPGGMAVGLRKVGDEGLGTEELSASEREISGMGLAG